MPPLAVPSSLVIINPVRGTDWPKASTWLRAFWPVVASSTSSTAWGAPGSSFLMTRAIFSSSAIRPALFCKRPAVSISSTSLPLARAFSSASKARPAASPPCLPATNSAPVRLAQIPSCSMAAARKVSPAASVTFAPPEIRRLAILPMVVVLPAPLTPATSTTRGLCLSSVSSGRATGASSRVISCASRVRNSSLEMSVSYRPLAMALVMDFACAPPRSARIRASSRSARVAASSFLRVKSPTRLSDRLPFFDRPDFSRSKKVGGGGGSPKVLMPSAPRSGCHRRRR